MAHNIDSMAYYGETPWHGLGAKLCDIAKAAEMITAAGLDWKVEKRPARGAKIDKKGDASKYQVIRLPRHQREQEVLLGLVTKRYRPLQNKEAFQFFDPIVGKNEACFETAGSLGQGERIWVMARMRGEIQVVQGDECWKYLLLSNCHTGSGSVVVKFTPVRVVCQNTLIMAMEDGQRAYQVRHTKSMAERLEQVAEIVAAAKQTFELAGQLFRKFARTSLARDQLYEYLDLVYPRTKSQHENGKLPDRWMHVLELLKTDESLQQPKMKGTLWAAYNAITRYEDYKKTDARNEPDRRLESVWFGTSADLKLKAWNQARFLVM